MSKPEATERKNQHSLLKSVEYCGGFFETDESILWTNEESPVE